MTYYRRAIDSALDALLPHARAIALDGPKAVGKTETAMQHSTHVVRLDDETQRDLIRANPDFGNFAPGGIVLDEWQLSAATFANLDNPEVMHDAWR